MSSFQDILNQGDLRIGVIRGSDVEDALKHSTTEPYRTLWATIQQQHPQVTVENVYQGLERVRRERFALILDYPEAEYYSRLQPCDLTYVGEFFPGRSYAFAARTDSDLVDLVNQGLLRLQVYDQ